MLVTVTREETVKNAKNNENLETIARTTEDSENLKFNLV